MITDMQTCNMDETNTGRVTEADYGALKRQNDGLLDALRKIVTAYRELPCEEAEPVMHRIAVDALAKAD